MVQGLVLVGTMPKCGKTIAACGIAGGLTNIGLRSIASKPILLTGAENPLPEFNIEQKFMDMVGKPTFSPETLIAPNAEAISPIAWKRLLEQTRQVPYPMVLEMPGTVATPLNYSTEESHGAISPLVDAIELARMLSYGIVVVTTKSDRLHEQLAPTLAYLAYKHMQPIGWLGVGTTPDSDLLPDWDIQAMTISRDYQVQYLGEIAFSPSIDFETNHQGNIVKQTEAGIDLLPIQQALEMVLL